MEHAIQPFYIPRCFRFVHAAIPTLVSISDRSALFCSSLSLFDAMNKPTPFCSFSGMVDANVPTKRNVHVDKLILFRDMHGGVNIYWVETRVNEQTCIQHTYIVLMSYKYVNYFAAPFSFHLLMFPSFLHHLLPHITQSRASVIEC